MGIQNLLRELKPITKYAKLSEFSGQTCGVDASCWLHRASYSCALELITGESTDKYLRFTLNCLNLLKAANITPIIIFDGAHLPMKANEEHRRNSLRSKNRKDALRFLKSGDKGAAWKSAQKAVHITKEMITGFMNQCIENNVSFVCAPYEADSQIGFMYKQKQIDFVISEDSDLLLFGVRKALYKFDPKTASGQFVDLERIKYYKQNIEKKRKMDLCWFLKKYWIKTENDDKEKINKKEKEFINVCVLSGCDYVDNLAGIGLKTAVKHCTEYRKMEHLLSNLMKRNKTPKDYKIQFNRAVLTFMHQTVYDIQQKKQKHLNPLTQSVNIYLDELKLYLNRLKPTQNKLNEDDKNPTVYDTTLDFLGKMVDDDTAKAIAQGEINARSLKQRKLITFKENFGNVDQTKQQNDDKIKKRKNVMRDRRNIKKESKYFGGIKKNENVDLDEIFTQFKYNEKENRNKDDHKPLQRKKRKRKRNVLEEYNESPLKNIGNTAKRRLNDDNMSSLTADLYSSSKNKENKKRSRIIVDKENIEHKRNNNPFSEKRKKKVISITSKDLSEDDQDIDCKRQSEDEDEDDDIVNKQKVIQKQSVKAKPFKAKRNKTKSKKKLNKNNNGQMLKQKL